jgi:hypothetical protein
MDFYAFFTHPITQAVLTGIAGAAAADFAAFRSWKSWQDGAVYNWATASWRWFQGAVVGLITGFGFSAYLG